MLRQSTPIPPTFQQGPQAPQGDIQKKKNIVYVCGVTLGKDGEMGSDVVVLLVYFLRVNKNLKKKQLTV